VIAFVMISEGDIVPKFELEDSDGNKIKSMDLKGKKQVLQKVHCLKAPRHKHFIFNYFSNL